MSLHKKETEKNWVSGQTCYCWPSPAPAASYWVTGKTRTVSVGWEAWGQMNRPLQICLPPPPLPTWPQSQSSKQRPRCRCVAAGFCLESVTIVAGCLLEKSSQKSLKNKLFWRGIFVSFILESLSRSGLQKRTVAMHNNVVSIDKKHLGTWRINVV